MNDELRCICGYAVAVPHQDCMSMLTARQRRNYNRGRPLGSVEEEDDD